MDPVFVSLAVSGRISQTPRAIYSRVQTCHSSLEHDSGKIPVSGIFWMLLVHRHRRSLGLQGARNFRALVHLFGQKFKKRVEILSWARIHYFTRMSEVFEGTSPEETLFPIMIPLLLLIQALSLSDPAFTMSVYVSDDWRFKLLFGFSVSVRYVVCIIQLL